MFHNEQEFYMTKCFLKNFKTSASFVVLPIKGKWLLRRLVLLPRGYCCACYQAKRWLQQMIIALCPNDFPSKGTKAKQSTGVEMFTFTMNLQYSSQKVRHFEMIYLTFIVLVPILIPASFNISTVTHKEIFTL